MGLLSNLALAHPVTSLERLPCANVQSRSYPIQACPNPGKLACSACELVSYCSKECQRKHWSIHKSDCKDPFRSPEWRPAWVREGRTPSFMGGPEDFQTRLRTPEMQTYALGMHLWGSLPAVDLLNLPRNEGLEYKQDLSIALAASGDLRNIVATVNALPDTYPGTLTVLLNDREPVVALRNFVLLLILGTTPDEAAAAELALHFWFSIIVPEEHNMHISRIVYSTLQKHSEDELMTVPLGVSSKLRAMLSPEARQTMLEMTASTYGLDEATAEKRRVYFAESRKDRHDRAYCQLEPSHRLALLEYRRFGLILPFGAKNDHFNAPNRFLFSANGRWLQNDLSTPLDGWPIDAVLAAGKAHGAQRADLFGNLYFYLTDQLRTFARRLRTLKLSFHVFDTDARALALTLKSDELPHAPRQFDRIDVSNILDLEYLGVRGVLESWGTLLTERAENPHATLTGYFMNWVARQPGAHLNSSSQQVVSRITKKFIATEKWPQITRPTDETLVFGWMGNVMAALDNSGAFEAYMEKQDTGAVCESTGLKRKSEHTVVPKRLGLPLDAPSNAVPFDIWKDKESWYRHVRLDSYQLSERFVEFGKA